MHKTGMGNNDELTAKEAASILGVSPQRVYQMNRKGELRSVGQLKQDLRFSLEEVCALADSKREKGGSLGIQLLSAKVVQLSARMGVLERQQESVMRMLGLRSARIGCNKAEVLSLYCRAEEAMNQPVLHLDDVREWTKIFLAFHEEVFDLVETHTNDPEPWSLFLRLAKKVYKHCPTIKCLHDDELVDPSTEFEAARRNLRAAAWSYVCNRRGRRAAEQTFPETQTDPLSSLLSNHCIIPGQPVRSTD